MRTFHEEEVQYDLGLEEEVRMNAHLGKQMRLAFTGTIRCQKCNTTVKKTFGDGYCYPCFSSAPETSECVLRPELCRAHLGEGRDPKWEEANHNQPHVVYLAASSAVKVGVTRLKQVPNRWMDQGASSVVIFAETPNRYEAGRIEVAMKDFFTDKTHWQKMLKNQIDESIDLLEQKWELEAHLPGDILEFFSEDENVWKFNYPVLSYPTKVTSVNLDKSPEIQGVLQGIKGQYLILEGGVVFNIRRHTGYEVELSFE
jgi:hypothetical protein